jgi:sortase A
MNNKPHYKQPESLKHKTLDLRNPGSFAVQPPKQDKQPQPQESKKPKKRKKSKRLKVAALILLVILLLVAALYILWLLFSPKVQKTSPQQIQSALEAVQRTDQNAIFIPTAGVHSPILEGGMEQLAKGLWHRLPERGDPKKGGNLIVTGHSFVWGYTPQQVAEKSIFYNLGDVKVGDEIIVYWDKQLYYYKVTETKTVKPDATEIEAKTNDKTLTIYTCTPSGSADGRVVVVAKAK